MQPKKPDMKGFELALNSANSSMRALTQSRNAFTEQFKSQDTKHPDSWDDYGYQEDLEFDDFYSMYKRNPFARAIIDRPVDKCWQNAPWILTSEERKGEPYNAWEKALFEFADKHQLWFKLAELDRMQSIGQYGALLVEVRDGKPLSQKMDKISAARVHSFKVLSESMLEVAETDTNVKSLRYGLPVTYTLSDAEDGDKNPDTNSSRTVHYTRVMPWAEGAVNDGIYGNSSLEAVWNTLINIEKISGAGGEGYYKSARGSMTMNIDTASDINKLAEMYGVELSDLPDAISDQVEAFNRNFDSVLAAQGVDFKPIQITVPDPSGFMSGYLSELAAGTGIPLTELIGQQTDERSSTENGKKWAGECESRQNGFLTRSIRKTIEWLQFHGIIGASRFAVCWDELYQPSMLDKLDIVSKMVDANLKHAQTLSTLAMAGVQHSEPALMFESSEVREVCDYKPLKKAKIDDDYDEEEIEDEENPS